MSGYYSDKLAAERLRKCYEISPPRVKQYLESEIEHVIEYTSQQDTLLELGCGYGRVLERLVPVAGTVIGIDTSWSSLKLARKLLRGRSHCHLFQMDACRLGFHDRLFDCVICIQNGISVFAVSQRDLIREAIRVTRPGGVVLFSTYSERFWDDRLQWFQLQADAGLLAEIDTNATGDGVIVCKDGFRATTVSPDEFLTLACGLEVDVVLTEVDASSLFCEMIVAS